MIISANRVTLLGSIVIALTLSGCTSSAPRPVQPGPVAGQVWPSPPAEPRIRLLRIFSAPDDLGIKKGFFQKLGEFFAGGSDYRLIRPMSVLVGEEGAIYVADPGAKGVHRFDMKRGRHRLIQRQERSPLPSPVGLARGPQGRIYVSDSFLNAVYEILPGESEARPLKLEAELHQPTGIAFAPEDGGLYVVDTERHRVVVFNRDGSLRGTLGKRGTGDGEFNFPTMIWRQPDGRLLVTDSLNFRIQIFDASGRFLGKFGKLGDGTGYLSRPKGVATDSFGHVYVVDALFHAVQVFDGQGQLLLHFGTQGRAPGEFWLPAGIYVGENDTIYVADSRNQRVQVFRYIGGQP